jgi:hypothetical protein
LDRRCGFRASGDGFGRSRASGGLAAQFEEAGQGVVRSAAEAGFVELDLGEVVAMSRELAPAGEDFGF